MRSRNTLRLPAAVLLSTLWLSGCQSIYHIDATMMHSKLIFIDRKLPWFLHQCVDSIEVGAIGNTKAQAADGDNQAAIDRGVFWAHYTGYRCVKSFPIIYGVPLPRSHDHVYYVAPKPLIVGVIYDVSTSGDGSTGIGRFEMLPNGSVANLPVE